MNISRLPWDKYFMLVAHVTATRSTCDRGPELLLDPGRHGVGAVLVKDRRVIAGGYNGSPPGQPHCNEYKCPKCKVSVPIIGNDEDAAWDQFIEQHNRMHQNCWHLNGSRDREYFGGHLIRDNHCQRTLHSEQNALLQCAMDGTSPEGATAYITASPCWDCAKSLIRAKIACVRYGVTYQSRYNLSGDVDDLLTKAGIECQPLNLTREQLGD